MKFRFLALPIFIGCFDAHSMDCSDLARLLIKWNQPSRVGVLIQGEGLTEPQSLSVSSQKKGRAAVLEVVEKTAPLTGDMVQPKELLIHLHPAGASWDFKTGILNHRFSLLSSQIGDQDRQEIAHEWAHVVFDMNLRAKSLVWDDIAKIHDRRGSLYRERILPIKREFHSLRQQLNDGKIPANKRAATELRIIHLIAEIQPLNKKFESDGMLIFKTPIENIKRPYEELWSDLIESFYSEIANGTKGGVRGFNRGFDWNQINDWNPSDVHHQLDPVRSWIGQNLLNKGEIDKATLTQKIFQVLTDELIMFSEKAAQGH